MIYLYYRVRIIFTYFDWKYSKFKYSIIFYHLYTLHNPYWINLHIIFKYTSYTSIRILIDYSYYYQVYSIIHRILQSRLWIGLIKESHDIEYKNIQIRIDLSFIIINKRLVLERRLLLVHSSFTYSLSTYESVNTISYILFFSIH